MFFAAWLVAVGSLTLIIQATQAVVCPFSYNTILNGCYKVNNGTNVSWTDAAQYCNNDSQTLVSNKTGFVTHLVALESAIETTSLVYWMKAWGIHDRFWTDGIAASTSWSWSKQTISWFFTSSERVIFGNGTNYRLVYNDNRTGYQIADELDQKLTHFICEYQERCEGNNSCLNNATCFLNVGRELCLCAPGFTGVKCDQEIDECLSSPCQHGGTCTDAVNNYTCDCSNIFFSGPNCETANPDPTQSQRSAAFWSVFGVVCSMVALLTISDLPWDDIARTVGCPWYRFKCCSHVAEEDDDFDGRQFNLSDSPTSPNQSVVTMSKTSTKGQNYHVMNTVWNPEQIRHDPTVSTSQPSNGVRSPDQRTTPDNILIQSFAAAVIEKQKQKQLDNKRVYAIDINENRDRSSNPTETMVSWPQQLQEQLKSKASARESSASSTRQLMPASNITDEN